MAPSMRDSGPVRPKFWTATKNNGLSPWYAAIRQRGRPVGRCAWWPRRPSNGDWCRRWVERPSGFCCSTTTSSRGGKKMWCVADLDEDYIAKMEDVLQVYERPFNPDEPVVCLDEKPV